MTKLSAIQASVADPVVPNDVYVHMIIDMQRGYVAALSEENQKTLPGKIEKFIAQTASSMRTLNIGVEDEEMVNFGSEEAKNWDCILKNSDGTPLRVDHWKKGSSAFKYQSNYTVSDRAPAHLHSTGANHIVLTGINECICVAETALDAVRLGYRVTIISDLVANGIIKNANPDIKQEEGKIAPAIQKCKDVGVNFETSENFLNRLNHVRPSLGTVAAPKPDFV